MREQYKIEKFKSADFPVYTSRQKGSGVIVVPHYHKGAELIMITEGSAEFFINAKQFSCRRGDIVFIPPYCVHSLSGNTPDSGIIGLVYELSLIPIPGAVLPEKVLCGERISDYIINCENPSYRGIKKNLLLAERAYRQECYADEMRVLSYLYMLTWEIMNNYHTADDGRKNHSRLEPVTDYIKDNYKRNITLSELSAQINVCRDHLIRIFKASTGRTPMEYIMDMRLEEALRLLINTDMSITEVSLNSGFSSSDYMTKVFNKKFNITPLKYRRNARQAVRKPL